jgi:putative hydrolase of the HAD superfamily
VALFDLDDTLFAHRHAVAVGVAEHVRTMGGPLAEADAQTTLDRWRDLEEQHYHRYLRGELDYRAQRRARARAFVEPYGITLADDRAADAWFDDYLAEYRRAWSVHPDVAPAFAALAGVRLGVISNGDRDFQTSKVDVAGLTPSIEHVITSGEVGFAKPDRRIFEAACDRFGVSVADAIYVGDRLQTDAIGAATAGLAGVWLDRENTATAAELAQAAASGVRVISTLADFPPLVLGAAQHG